MVETDNVIAKGSQDFKTIEDFVNLPAGSDVRPRLLPSVNVGTLSGARDAIFEAGGLPAKPFPTLAKMQTDGATLLDGALAFVHDDTINNGLYVKTAGSWVKSEYDPVMRDRHDETTNAIISEYTFGGSYTNEEINGLLTINNHTHVGLTGITTKAVLFDEITASISNSAEGKIEYRVFIGSDLSSSTGAPVSINKYSYSGICTSFPTVNKGVAQKIRIDSLIHIPPSTPFVIVFKHETMSRFTYLFFSDSNIPSSLLAQSYFYRDAATGWSFLEKSSSGYNQSGFRLSVRNDRYSNLNSKIDDVTSSTNELITEIASATQTPKEFFGSIYTDAMLVGNSTITLSSHIAYTGTTSERNRFNKVKCSVFNATAGKVYYRLYLGKQVGANGTVSSINIFTEFGECLSFPKSSGQGVPQEIILDKILTIPEGVTFTIAFVHENAAPMTLSYFTSGALPSELPDTRFVHSTNRVAWGSSLISAELDSFKQAGFKFVLDYRTSDSKPEADKQEIILPPKIYAVQELETNIYFKHTVDCDYTIFDYDVICAKGRHRQKRWAFTPSSSDTAGEHDFALKCFDKRTHAELASATSRLVIASKASNSGVTKKVMVIGDSWVDRRDITQTLLDNAANDVMNIELIGTRGTSPNFHEGRSGWTVARYMTADTDNAFWNSATSSFDLPNYLAVNSKAVPDVVVIQLGINDVVNASNTSQVINIFNTAKVNLDKMITSIKLSNPTVKIVIAPPPTQSDQNGWSASSGTTAWRAQINMYVWTRETINHFKDREAQGVYVVGSGFGVDIENNFPTVTAPVNARSDKTETTINDPYHAIAGGYQQIGDQLFAFIKTT